MVSSDLLEILVCPACHARLEPLLEKWLICENEACRRKYPIKDGIPIMLIEEGDKYASLTVDELPDTV